MKSVATGQKRLLKFFEKVGLTKDMPELVIIHNIKEVAQMLKVSSLYQSRSGERKMRPAVFCKGDEYRYKCFFLTTKNKFGNRIFEVSECCSGKQEECSHLNDVSFVFKGPKGEVFELDAKYVENCKNEGRFKSCGPCSISCFDDFYSCNLKR